VFGQWLGASEREAKAGGGISVVRGTVLLSRFLQVGADAEVLEEGVVRV
jgi:hypothetical protein